VTGCRGEAPPVSGITTIEQIREKVASGARVAATDLSRGGLIAALARFLPGASVSLAGDPLAALFSETYGRFLVAFQHESDLAGMEYTRIGEVCREGLTIATTKGEILLSATEISHAAGTLTRIMAGERTGPWEK